MPSKILLATHIIIFIIFSILIIALADQEIGGWQLEAGHPPAGGVFRLSDDGQTSDLIPDPVIDAGSNPPLDIEQVFTHPNYGHLSPLTECGYSPMEVSDYDVNMEDDSSKNSNKSVDTDPTLPEEKRLKRIVGGKPVVKQNHPWMAQLYLLNITSGEHWFHCGGTLISNNTILTAAHCLTRINAGNSLDVVVVGQLDRRKVKFCKTENPEERCSRSYIRDIEDYQVHNGYSEGNLIHDIGLIYLRKPVKINSRVRPVCLPYSSSLLQFWPNLKLTAVGWGSMDKLSEGPTANVLKQVELDLQSRLLCDKFHTRMYGKVTDSRICIGGNTGSATCNGDSGSGILKTLSVPLLDNKEKRVFQLGIVSAGGHVTDTCGFQGRPTIVTNVIHYMPWILNHIVAGALSYQWSKTAKKEGSWISHKTNDGMYMKKHQQLEASNYKNEFSTGKNVNVSDHPNRYLLPTFQYCGNLNDDESTITNASASYDESIKKRTKRLVGGIPTSAERFLPWMAQIYVRNVEKNNVSLRCSGTLISCRHILTTATCVTEILAPYVFDSIIVGQYNRNSSKECINGVCYFPVKVKVKDIIVHAEFEKYTFRNNIALVRLSEDLTFNRFIQPICLPQREALIDGMNVHRYFSAGWGIIDRESLDSNYFNQLSEILLQMYVDILPRKDCDFVYSRQIGLLDRSLICGIGKTPSTGECAGDSGSPLMKKMEADPANFLQNKVFQLGIVSYMDCGLEGMPTVYTNVVYYLKWILDNLEDSI
ncbi:unnamed protein product [Orchesella dallaii]|uniref:Peptidase S1 domain-containing protein n=1 Tax=Orchesella dallaii TaxID=48710 RepID=A0ABP1PS44_9HEXA